MTSARDKLTDAALAQLLDAGSPEQSLRSFAAALGVSHSLLLYHFGSTVGLLSAVHRACEQRQREHLGTLRTGGADPVAIMRAMWRHLAVPSMWPVYRLRFALRVRADVVTTADQQAERDQWVAAVVPLVRALGIPRARDEALLWVATCRGLLWELVTGADPVVVNRAAHRFFGHYRTD